jgi:hypothetical protein
LELHVPEQKANSSEELADEEQMPHLASEPRDLPRTSWLASS